MPITHPTPPDGTFSPAGAAAWQEEHTLPTPAEIGAAESGHDHGATYDAAGTAAALVSAHEAAADPHPGYRPLSGAVAVTVPQPGRMEWQETVTATGVTAAHRVLLSVGAHADSDENSAELLDVSAMEATAGTNQIAVSMSFAAMTAGVIRLNYLATA